MTSNEKNSYCCYIPIFSSIWDGNCIWWQCQKTNHFCRCSQNRIKNYFKWLNRKFPNDLSLFALKLYIKSVVNSSKHLCIEKRHEYLNKNRFNMQRNTIQWCLIWIFIRFFDRCWFQFHCIVIENIFPFGIVV